MAKKSAKNPFDDEFNMPNLDDIFAPKTNDAFTPEEMRTIEDLSAEYPAIKKLADRYALLFSEPDKEFYAALAFASKEISTHIFNGSLDVDNTNHKAMMMVLEKGGAYYKTLQVGKEKSGDLDASDEVSGAVAPKKKQTGSIAEKYAKR